MRRALLIGIWLLLITIMTVSDRAGDGDATKFGTVALLKIASRGTALMILVGIVAWTWSDPRRNAIIKQLLPWFCFGVWTFVTVLWSPLVNFSAAQSMSLNEMFLLAYCVAMLGTRTAYTSQLLFNLCVGLVLMSVVVLVATVVDPTTFGDARYNVTGGFHPTNTSATAGLGILLLVCTRVLFGWPWTRWLLWPAIGIHLVMLYVAQNRASIIITTLIIAGFMFLQSSGRRRVLLLSICGFILTVYLALDPGFSLLREGTYDIAQYMSRNQSAEKVASLSGRDEMWAAMWDSFLEAPIMGHGYFVTSEGGWIKVWSIWANWTAHNFWLQVLTGTGLIGGGLLAFALVSYAFRLLFANQGVGVYRWASLALAVFAWQTLWGLTNESFAGPIQAESVVFFIIVGLATARLVHGSETHVLRVRAAWSAHTMRPVFDAPRI